MNRKREVCDKWKNKWNDDRRNKNEGRGGIR